MIRVSSQFFNCVVFALCLSACQKTETSQQTQQQEEPIVAPQLTVGNSSAATNPWAAMVGGDSSGGGPSIVCRNPDHTISSARILDLYEAEVLYGHTVPNPGDAYADQISAIADRLNFDKFVRIDFLNAYEALLDDQKFLPAGVTISPSNDLGEDTAVPVPNGCRIELVGFYEKSGNLVVSRTLFDALSERDKAAFYTHEALYRMARYFHRVSNSSVIRLMVGRLFASNTNENQLKEFSKTFFWPGRRIGSATGFKEPNYYWPLLIEPGSTKAVALQVVKVTKYPPDTVSFVCTDRKGEFQYGFVDVSMRSLIAIGSLPLPIQGCTTVTVIEKARSGNDNGQSIYRISYGNQILFEGVSSGPDSLYYYQTNKFLEIPIYVNR